MTEQEVQRLREAGISDEVIMDMMKKPDEAKSEGYIDPNTPSETFSQAEGLGKPVSGPETSMSQLGTEALMLVPDALKYVGLPAAGAYGLKKLGEGMMNRGAPGPATTPSAPSAPSAPATSAPATSAPVKPVAPTIEPGGQRVVDFTKQTGDFKKPGIVQQGIDYTNRIRQAAMERVIQPAGQMLSNAATYSNPTASAVAKVARPLTGIGALAMPGNLGQNYPFPTSGPMRGREINPTTGAPWTASELEAYRAQYGT